MTGPLEQRHHSQEEDVSLGSSIDPDILIRFSDTALQSALGVDDRYLDQSVDRLLESLDGLSPDELKSIMKELVAQRMGPEFIAELQAHHADQSGVIFGQAEQLSHNPEMQSKIDELTQEVKQIPVWRATTGTLLSIIKESGDPEMIAKAEAALEPVLPDTEPIEQQVNPLQRLIGQIATTATRIVKPQSSHKKSAA